MRRTGGAPAALLFGVLFALLGSLGFVGSWAVYRLDSAIGRSGAQAQGQVIRKQVLRAADGDTEYTVDYRFNTPGGGTIVAHRGVSKALWDTLQQDAPFVVRYSAANPNRNFPAGGGATSLRVTVFLSLISLVFAAFGSLLAAGCLRGHTDRLRS